MAATVEWTEYDKGRMRALCDLAGPDGWEGESPWLQNLGRYTNVPIICINQDEWDVLYAEALDAVLMIEQLMRDRIDLRSG